MAKGVGSPEGCGKTHVCDEVLTPPTDHQLHGSHLASDSPRRIQAPIPTQLGTHRTPEGLQRDS